MTITARREYMKDTQVRYQRAENRKQKSRIISEVVNTLGCHRKHAIRLLNGPAISIEKSFRHREPLYPDYLIQILESVWEATGYLWSERLKPALVLWMPWIRKRYQLSKKDEEQLLSISPSTIDRRLKDYKQKHRKRIYGKTKAGKFLRQRIPIQTESWQIKDPGWIEIDTVSHSGPNASGIFAYTVNATDLFSGWVESRAVLGKGSDGVVKALDEMIKSMPFEVKGIDSDNGEEFINWHLERYCRETGLKQFRSRPYKKDDQAHIEQKNWTHVRKLIGWDRYDSEEAISSMNDLYEEELRILNNFFLPSVKLSNKIRVGSKIKRIYEEAKTPLDRLIKSNLGDIVRLNKYNQLRKVLNPFEISKIIDKKLEIIWSLASKTRIDSYIKRSSSNEPISHDGNAFGPLTRPFANIEIKQFRKQWYKEKLLGTR